MSFLSRLFGLETTRPKQPDDRSTIQNEIERRLVEMPEDRARYLAAFAGLMGRVADADQNISPEEMDRIRQILRDWTGLDEKESELVADVIHEQTKALLGLENHIYTRIIREVATREQKTEILHCLFLVASADDEITSVENEEIRIIAKGMNLSHEEFIAERSAFSDKLSVMRKLG